MILRKNSSNATVKILFRLLRRTDFMENLLKLNVCYIFCRATIWRKNLQNAENFSQVLFTFRLLFVALQFHKKLSKIRSIKSNSRTRIWTVYATKIRGKTHEKVWKCSFQKIYYCTFSLLLRNVTNILHSANRLGVQNMKLVYWHSTTKCFNYFLSFYFRYE